MRRAWAASLVAVAVAAGAGGFALGRAGRPAPVEGPDSAELAFARLLALGDTAADPPPVVVAERVAAVAVDPAATAYAGRVLALADRDGSDPRRLPLLRAAAGGLRLAEIADADRDGLDDDGKVQVGGACVLLPVSATYDAEFAAGSCAAATAHPTVTGELDYGPKPFPESYLRTL